MLGMARRWIARRWTEGDRPRTILVLVAWIALLAGAPGCAQLGGGQSTGIGGRPKADRVQYSKQARVSVSPFQNSSGASHLEWKGSRSKLAGTVRAETLTALRETGAFQLADGAGSADLLVLGDVVRFRSGSAAGPDELSLQLRVVDTRTQRALSTATVTGTPDQLRSSKSAYSSALEKTVRVAALRAARHVTRIANDAGLLEVGGPETDPEDGTTPRELPPPDPKLEAAQVKLNALGYGCGGADGRMGPRTRACISSYQEEMGLEPTGSLDEATAAQLNL